MSPATCLGLRKCFLMNVNNDIHATREAVGIASCRDAGRDPAKYGVSLDKKSWRSPQRSTSTDLMAVPRVGVQEGNRVNSGFISPTRLAEMNRIQQATSQQQAQGQAQPPPQSPQPPQPPQPPHSTLQQQQGSRLSSFFSSFRSDSRTSGEANPQAANMSRYDELGRKSNDRPQPTRNQTQHSSKLQSQRARGHSGSSGGTLQRRTTLAVVPPPRISAGKTLHPEIEQVVALTLAHSSKIYCSGALARKIERQSDGSPAKLHEAGWSDVWAQLGGTTMSVWDMEAINKASQEGKEVPPTYLNVTDSVSQPTPNLRRAN